MTIFLELSLLMALTTFVTLFMRALKQPLVVGYILSGIIAGPYILNLVHSTEELELFSKVGIVFLLFIVGLHLNPKVIKEVGKVSLITGIGQVVFTSLIGFVIAIFLGISQIAAIYVAIALTFSSTIIILKLLADKNDLQKLYAKIAVGFLLVQDIIATVILIAVTVTASGQNSIMTVIGLTLIKGLVLLISLILIAKYIIPALMKHLANSPELLFLFSLSWGMALSSLFLIMGFSIEIGALVAGVILSLTSYAEEISSRLKPLRDFFIIVFFILLGSQMMIANLSQIIVPAVVLSLFVLIGNPFIVIILMNLVGYNRRTGFMAGLTVAQISEFSLILASLGLRLGHLSQEVMSLITLVGLITIAGSTYLILYSDKIYPKTIFILKWLELLKSKRVAPGSIEENYNDLIFGYDRVGHHFVKVLKTETNTPLVVDYNPASIERLQKIGLPFRYGDASDAEFLDDLPVQNPRVVVSTIPDMTTNKLIINRMLAKNPKALVIPISHNVSQTHELYEAGAAYVIMPHHLGAEYAAKLIKKHGDDHKQYQEIKNDHLLSLTKVIN